jgi:predicted transcriptional regulator of viral defense system
VAAGPPLRQGIAQADYGTDAVALMGVSAARQHGAIPRAIAVAVVAVPKQRPTLRLAVGELGFVERDVSRLEVERLDGELTNGWVTTVEQTLLDLAARPALGGLTMNEIRQAAEALATRADWELLVRLAKKQHRPSALRRAHEWAGRT